MMLTLEDHRAARLAALQAEDGWLNLIDRVPLGPGVLRVGSDPGSADPGAAVVLSRGPGFLGLIEGSRFTTPEGQVLRFEQAASGMPQLRVDPFLLELHADAGLTALRVRDLTLPRVAHLAYFDTNPDWVIQARWEPLEVPQQQVVAQKGGSVTEVTLTHRAVFDWQGQRVTLLPTHWKGGKPMFVIRDRTSGVDSYAASRFLIGEVTGDSVLLDFNRAFTPPCGFTDFAICPLPPRDNILPFRIKAGEKTPL